MINMILKYLTDDGGAARCGNSFSHGLRNSSQSRNTSPVALILGLGLFFVVGGYTGLGQALTESGTKGVAKYRGTVHMRGLSILEEKRGWTNFQTQSESPRPLPKYPRESVGDLSSPLYLDSKTTGEGGSGGATANATSGMPSPSPSISFLGLDDNQTRIPPDTHGAVGPNHVLTTLNSQVRVQDRLGNVLSTVALSTFWISLGVSDVFDPKALYDHMSGRFIVTAMATRRSANSAVLIGVSQTSDPTGNWFIYEIDADATDSTWADYPSIGFNKDWIVVSANMFTFFDSFDNASIWVFDKADLYANGVGNFTLFQETSATSFTMVPAITHDSDLDTMYLVETDLSTFGFTASALRISEITGPVGNETINFNTASVSTNASWGTFDPNFTGFLPQLGSFFGIDGGDTRMQNVVYRNGSLWCTHTAFLPAFSPTYTAAQWWQFLPDGSVQQFGRVEDLNGVFSYAYPTIAVNARNDVLIGASQFSANTYASASYSFREFGDPPNLTRDPYVFKAGEGPYFKTGGGFANRWGDYSSTMVDPRNDLDMWTLQEYAATPVLGDPFSLQGRWGTWWALVTSRDRFEFSSRNYSINEAPPPGFATVTVLNVGGVAGSVDYATSDGTAVSGVDYLPASGTLAFLAGQESATFSIPIFDNPDVNLDKTVNLRIFNPTGGNELGLNTNAVLTIIDDETAEFASTAGEFNFSTYVYGIPFYEATENESIPAPFAGQPDWIELERSTRGVLVTVVRTNGSTGRVLVDYSTPDGGTAQPFIDYIPVSGTLVFDHYQMSTNFIVPVLNSFFLQTNFFSANTINLALSNPRPAPEEELERPGLIRPTLGLGDTSGIFVYKVNSGFSGLNAFSWERINWRVDEYDGRNPVIPTQSKVIDLTIILAPGFGPGSVRVIFPNHVGGFILQAGSDYAASPVGGAEVLANPQFTDPTLNTITNVWDYIPIEFEDFGNGDIYNGGVVSFGGGQARARVQLVITNDADVEFNEDVIVSLRPLPGNPPVFLDTANVTILHDDQPAGALDREWNPDNNPLTVPSNNKTPGANNVVNSVSVQSDGKSVIGGDFTSVNSQPRNRVARFNADGSLDTTFVVGNGADDFVSTVIAIPTNAAVNAGTILIAGGFSSYNSFSRNGVARLLSNGSIDPTFAPGNAADGAVYALALQADGRVVVAGDFFNFNNVARNGIARLNLDGSLDLSFDPGDGPFGNIWSLALVPDGLGGEKILIGGDFLLYDNVFRRGVAQLNPDGSLDPTFDPGGGVNGPVFALGLQNDGAIILGGGFTEYDARKRINLVRLFPDGSLDPGFDPGNGPNDLVFTLKVQDNQKTLIGGRFTEYNGTRRLGLARLRMDGALDTSFMDTAYNHFAGLINTLSFEPPNYLNSIDIEANGDIMIGGSFDLIGGNPSYTTPVRDVNFYIPEDNSVVFTRSDKRSRLNVARVLGGNTPGPGNVSFDNETYYVDENSEVAALSLSRTDGRLGTLIGEAESISRTAEKDLDFASTNLTAIWPEFFYQTNIFRTFPWLFPTNFSPRSVGKVEPIFLNVPILDDSLREGDEVLDLEFTKPGGEIILGGEYIPLGGALGRSSASLVVADDDFDAGIFNFASTSYFTNENALFALVSVIRTNGTVGQVSVNYMTGTNVVPPRATPGVGNDYRSTSGTLLFQSGQSQKSFFVEIIDDGVVEFDENIGLLLTNATGGAKLPGLLPTSIVRSTLTILDNDFPPGRLTFSSPEYQANESDGYGIVTVTRGGGNVGAISIGYETLANGSAIPGVDFISTNGILRWNDGETIPKTFRVPLIPDGEVEGPETFDVRLFDGRVGGVPNPNLAGLLTNAVFTIEDGDAFGEVVFSQPFYQVDEVAGTAYITVVRRSGMAGTGFIDFDVTADSAVPGEDFVPTSGTLTFAPGVISQTFPITILDDDVSDGNKAVTITLENEVNLMVGMPNPVTLTIIDDESFNEPAGSADVTFAATTQANGPVFGLALQLTNGLPDGRILVAGEFTDFNQVVRNRLARLNTDGSLDFSFDPGPGANGSIRSIASQPDGKLLVGGFFTQVIGTNRNGIARLSQDGTIDRFFNPGSGADNPVYKILLQPDGRILVGGAFSTFNNISSPGIVRLNTNGVVDLSFNTGTGPNNTVFAVALQNDGKILIGGDFTAVNNVPRNRIARLNSDGTLDTSFDPGVGVDGTVRSIVVQLDGQIVVGGSFTTVDGVGRSYLARLDASGALDASYLDGLAGANNVVLDMALQVDGKLIVVGDFTRFNDVTRNRITRLNTDGTTDTSINFGSGTDRFVATTVIQPDRKILIGGDFTTYNDRPRLRVARLHGGAISGGGQLEFSSPQYFVEENGTNALIKVRRLGGTEGEVGVDYGTVNGTALDGVDYMAVTGPLVFPPGETQRIFEVPIIDNSDVNGNRTLGLELIPGSITGGATRGPQPNSLLTILDDEGSVGFIASNFSVSEGTPSGLIAINVGRFGAISNAVSVDFFTSTNGTATQFMDYFPTNGVLNFAPGELNKTFHVRIINDNLIEGNETVVLTLANVTGSNVLSIADATLLILDNDFGPGQIQFTTNIFQTIEGNEAALTVIRTNGSTGIVSVEYRTDDDTADSVSDYFADNNVLAFADGETFKVILIPTRNDSFFERTEDFVVSLFNPTGGATLGSPINTFVGILDDDTNVVVAAGSVLVAEGILPPNNAIDPNETVTLDLFLRNIGTSDTLGTTAILLPGNGVTMPSGPQDYGVLTAGGAAVSRPYTFRAVGNNGDQLVASLLLVESGVTNSLVNYRFTLGGNASRSFVNTNVITINDVAIANPYPSSISVVNLGGIVTNISVTLSNLTHPYPGDLDILLVGPNGQSATLMSDAGAGLGLNNVNLRFSDAAPNILPEFGQILSQSYVPTNYAGFGTADTFPFPAPPLPYTNSSLSVFQNTGANGIWSLYVVDDDIGQSGRIAKGWGLTFQTSDPISQAADLGITAFATPTPVAVGDGLICVINVTNYGPAAATSVVVQDEMPASFNFASASSTAGSWTKNGDTLTFNVGSLPSGSGASLTIQAQPTQLGTVTNTLSVTGQEADVIQSNNEVTMVTTVLSQGTLVVVEENGYLIISWPLDGQYILQSTDNLTTPTWTDVALTPTLINGQYRVIIPVGVGNRFYRLRSL